MLKACMCLCGQDTPLTHGGRRDWGPFCKNGVTASHVLEMRLPQEVPEKQRGLRETHWRLIRMSPLQSHTHSCSPGARPARTSIHTILFSDTVKSLQLPVQGACIFFPRQQGMSANADRRLGTLETQTLICFLLRILLVGP